MSTATQFQDLSPAARKALVAHSFSDVWAEQLQLQVDGRPWNLKGRPYLRDVYRTPAQHVVCRKAAQMGFTVAFLIKTLHRVLEWRWSGLYLLPTKVGVVPFVQGRFNPIIDDNARIKQRFARLDSVTHKQTVQNKNLYFRGTTVQTDLREIPVDFEIWDERDKMMSSNLPLALTRMDGSDHKHLAELSTPTAENWGVDASFKDSDGSRWFIPCLFCGEKQTLTWDDHVVIGDTDSLDACKKTTILRCAKCHKPWTHAHVMEMTEQGQWVAEFPERDTRGYYINQLVSPTRNISELATVWYKGEIRGEIDELRELWNSALGLPWAAPGDKLTPEILDRCVRQSYRMPGLAGYPTTQPISIGVDVGKYLHVTMLAGNAEATRRLVDLQTTDWDGLWAICRQLRQRKMTWTMVIDANPEKSQAEALGAAFPMNVWLAYYVDPRTTSDVARWDPPDPQHGRSYGKVMIDRTMAIDTGHNAIVNERVVLPYNARALVTPGAQYGDFYAQMTVQTAVTVPDKFGNPRRVYVQPGERPDHFDHSYTYGIVASLLDPATSIAPEFLRMDSNPVGNDIVQEVDGLFVQDDEGISFDGIFEEEGW